MADLRKKLVTGLCFNREDQSFLLFYLCFVDLKKIFFKAAIARLEVLENDYTGMETVEAVDDDEASLEYDGIRVSFISLFCVFFLS